jgi:hypothetical protein
MLPSSKGLNLCQEATSSSVSYHFCLVSVDLVTKPFA